MIRYKKGSVLDTSVTHIAQGVNCQNKMASGVAKVIFEKFPEVKTNYHNYFKTVCEPFPKENQGKDLLGRVQFVKANDKIILNCFTQNYYGIRNVTNPQSHKYVSYDAIYDCFRQMVKCGLKEVAIPKIGSDRAGGDWNIIEQIINSATKNELTVFVYILEEDYELD